jgi:transposase
MFEKTKENLVDVVNVLADGGYSGKNFADAIKEILNAKVEVIKRNELHTFKRPLP